MRHSFLNTVFNREIWIYFAGNTSVTLNRSPSTSSIITSSRIRWMSWLRTVHALTPTARRR